MTIDTEEKTFTEVKAILRRVAKLRTEKEKIEEEENLLWKRFFEIADDISGEGEPYRYVDRELRLSIARSYAVTERMDPEKLESLLSHEQWVEITRQERVLDNQKLEAAVTKGIIPSETISEVLEVKKTARKLFGASTKADMQ